MNDMTQADATLSILLKIYAHILAFLLISSNFKII